jgi:hypothetical protein
MGGIATFVSDQDLGDLVLTWVCLQVGDRALRIGAS